VVEDEGYQLQSWCRSNLATLDLVALAKARGLYIGRIDDGEDEEHWLRCPYGDDGHRVRFRPAAQTNGFEYEERDGDENTLGDRGLALLSSGWDAPVLDTEELACSHATCRVRGRRRGVPRSPLRPKRHQVGRSDGRAFPRHTTVAAIDLCAGLFGR
jgi:hypothetical protein